MPDGLKLQARYLDRLAAIPVEPYPQPPLEWLSSLDGAALAWVANRLLDKPNMTRWKDRDEAQAAVVYWLAAESDSREDRLRHHMLHRLMRIEAQARTCAEVPDGGW